jgi:purine-cytosine permease-like protein
MPFVVGCLALVFPRVALILVWLLGGSYLSRAYESWAWPALGFLFLPLTTLTFAFAHNSVGGPGVVTPLGWLLTGLAVLGDLGILSSGRKSRKRKSRDRD